jgi:hypothetical protein
VSLKGVGVRCCIRVLIAWSVLAFLGLGADIGRLENIPQGTGAAPLMRIPTALDLTSSDAVAARKMIRQFVDECPLLAQMRSADRVRKRPMFGVERTYCGHHESDANDPKAT